MKQKTNPIPIQRHVPVPQPRRVYVYPIPYMKEGDSFFVVPRPEQSYRAMRYTIQNCIKREQRRYPNKHFILRAVKEGGWDGYRCWRIG